MSTERTVAPHARGPRGSDSVPMINEQQRRAQLAKDLLEDVKFALKLDSDRALAHRLGITPGYISKLRNGILAINAKMIVRLHEETGMSIARLKRYLPDGKLSD